MNLKKNILGAASVLVSAFMTVACVSCNEKVEEKVPTFANPIYSLVASNSSTRVGEADPWVYKHSDGYYYYCASYGNTFDRIQLRRAKTIDLLDSADSAEVATIITPKTGNFAKITTYLWAPEIQYIEGAWYLFFTANCNDSSDPAYSGGPWAVKNYIAKCEDDDPLSGEWKLVGRMRAVKGDTIVESELDSSEDANTMDVTLFRYAGDTAQNWIMNLDGTAFKVNGQWYFAWAENLYDGGWADEGASGDGVLTFGGVDHPNGANTGAWSSIIIGKVADDENGSPDFTRITNATPISAPQYKWEWGEEVYDENGEINSFEMKHSPSVNVNEGPAVLVRNGKVFLVFSASACDASYCLGMLTADQTADLCNAESWSKSATPVFTTSVSNGVYGPGHCSFTTYKGYDVIVYHARQWPGLYSYYGRTNNYKETSEGLSDPYRTGRAKVFTWNDDGTPNFGEAE